ncbi:E3 ubiquitin-protein ligase SINA-like 10 [Triticum dicoccoides]|uniref:E3 ubiquitin-protein ligase SINA-like 10 n=1 Tax=Triticum dicoccoides TaxID=85692 RepID=UPI00188E58DB|nr:E3 ubiquitin-protein ligase SINA-like 10 [Triticum dicoccoides]
MQGAAAAAEGRSRASPDKADEESAKKPRLDLPDAHSVKQELVAPDAAGGGDPGGIVAAAAPYSPREELAVRIDKRLLHCPLCTLPFKPPVFQCKAGHLACGGCVAQLPRGQCKACVDGAGFFDQCPALDAVVSSTRIECPNAGCPRYVTYHEVAEHQTACAHAPCRCTEPGCGYVGAPQALAGHLHTVHSVPVRAVQYGKASQLRVPVSAPRLVLLGDDDNRVFLLTVGALGAGVTAVSVVCARASAATRPRFACKMWVNLEAAAANGGKEDMVLVDMHMSSSSSPGAVVAAGEPTFLMVPPMYLVPAAAAGDGAASMEVPLHIRIDKLSPWSDALV